MAAYTTGGNPQYSPSKGKGMSKSAKKPLPPPPGASSSAVGTGSTPGGSGAPVGGTTGTVNSQGRAVSSGGHASNILTGTTNATNALGKKAIGEGGFKADIEIGGKLDTMLHDNIMGRLDGSQKRSDIVFDGAQEKLFKATQGQTKRGKMAAMADAARRGIFRSDATGAVIADIETEGIKAYSEGVKDILIQKAQMDYDDMVKAIEQGQQWLSGTRQYQLGLEQNAIAREQIKATMAAAAMQAGATMYAADQALKGAHAAAGASRWAAQMGLSQNSATDAGGNIIMGNGPYGAFPLSRGQYSDVHPPNG